MNGSAALTRFARVVGWLMLAAGVSVFAIRLHHAGPYAMPERGNLRAGVLALAIGLALLLPWLRAGTTLAGRLVTIALLAASPVVLFFALYATLAELEEVVVLRATDSVGRPANLRATDSVGRPANLRLWVVDADDRPWVSMSREKAEEHSLDGARVELLRAGRTSCVVPALSHDPAENDRTFRLRDRKYRIQRLGRAIGMFGDGPAADTVTLRLDPCPGSRPGS